MKIKRVITSALIFVVALFSQTSFAESLFNNEIEIYRNEIAVNADFNLKNIKIKEDKYVYLGGQTVGIAFYTDGIYVTDTVAIEDADSKYHNTANDAGIKKGDYILSANGIPLTDISNLDAILKSSKGEKIKLKVKRDNKTFETEILPIKNKEDQYRLGLWMRDSAAGLGTITYIDPDNNTFGALGHAVCDNETGKSLSVGNGRIVECDITGVIKGNKGNAGELKGSFGINARQIGEISENTKFGLVGKIYSLNNKELIKLGSKYSVKEGDAHICSDFENGQMKKYSIKILHVNNQTYPSEKSMIIQITDKSLIEKTGGIVQGLSGSPIIQDGRLIGAVTHVMINEPTKGYGIFIENMIS